MFYIPVVNKVTLGHVFLQVATSVFPCKHHSATVLHSHFIHLPSTLYFSFPMALQPNSALGRLTVDVSKSHTIGHTRTHTHTRAHTHARARTRTHTRTRTHSVRPFGTSDQLVTDAATCTTQNTCMPSAGLETAIPVIERLQTYALRPGSASTLYNPGKSHHYVKC